MKDIEQHFDYAYDSAQREITLGNIMNKNSLLTIYDKDLRMRIMYPEARREITGNVVRFIRKAPGMNFVSFTFANEPDLEHVIDRELEYFAPMNQPFTWKVYDHDLLPSLETKLMERNFITDDDPATVMVLDISDAPAYLNVLSLLLVIRSEIFSSVFANQPYQPGK